MYCIETRSYRIDNEAAYVFLSSANNNHLTRAQDRIVVEKILGHDISVAHVRVLLEVLHGSYCLSPVTDDLLHDVLDKIANNSEVLMPVGL